MTEPPKPLANGYNQAQAAGLRANDAIILGTPQRSFNLDAQSVEFYDLHRLPMGLTATAADLSWSAPQPSLRVSAIPGLRYR